MAKKAGSRVCTRMRTVSPRFRLPRPKYARPWTLAWAL